ncbi:MAG: DEAD/DEAH box helicase [Lachnospiraceae bacterium]|nr:DEAD/DEAH box helicase [Lachnospiraceae bacterium]
MQRWTDYFSGETIDKAMDMCFSGKVKKPEWNNDGDLVLTVRDDRNYTTIVGVDMDSLLCGLSCTCEKGIKNEACVHMAAGLNYYESYTDEDVYVDFSVLTKEEREALPRFEVNPSEAEGKSKNKSSGAGKSSESESNIKEQNQGKKKGDKNLDGKTGKHTDEYGREVLVYTGFGDIERLQKENRVSRKSNPVYQSDKSGEKYSYFDFKEITKNFKVSADILKKAKELLRSPLKKYEVSTGYSSEMKGSQELIGTAYAEGTGGKGLYANWSANINFSKNKIISTNCRTWGCARGYYSYKNSEPCEHCVACILHLEKYLRDNNIGDATNVSGIRLINHVSRNAKPDNTELKKDIHIEPLVTIPEYGYPDMYVTFKAGTDKLYVVKDISEFVKSTLEQEEYSFGKNKTVRLSRERICDDSLLWFEYMERKQRELDKSTKIAGMYSYSGRRSYGYEPEYILGKEIGLKEEELDEFFDTGKGQSINYKKEDEGIKQTGIMKLCEKPLPLKLKIKKDTDLKTNEFRGILLEGDTPMTFNGNRHSYYMTDDSFVRVISEDDDLTKSLLSEEEGGYIRVQIGRRHLREFYSKTLPALRKIAEINEIDREEIDSYIPPEPEFAFFMDVDEGLVVCKADVYYGANIFSLTDNIDGVNGRTFLTDKVRDTEREIEVLNILGSYLREYDKKGDMLFCEKTDEDVFRLLDHGLDELMELGEVFTTERFKRLVIKKSINFSMGVSVESNIMDLEISSDELSKEDLLAIFYGYKKKQNFVKLTNGDFIKIDQSGDIAALSEAMDAMNITPEEFVRGKMHIPAYRALYLDRMLEGLSDVYTDRDKRFKRLIREFGSVENSDFDIPKGYRSVLRSYQQLGHKWLRMLDHYGFGGILADDMGLGKTLQVISVMSAVCDEETARGTDTDGEGLGFTGQSGSHTSLVVCPASLVYNWGEEITKFAPTLKYGLILGSQEERRGMINRWNDYSVLVTSYDLLKRDIDAYAGKKFRFEIIDEAQYIKNHNTEAAKTVKLIEAQTKYALTGTPIENRLSELWSIFDYLMPGLLYTYSDFRSKLEIPIVKYDNKEASEQLRRMVQPFILRRLKGDVLKDLPEKLDEIRYAGMAADQRNLYDAQVVRMRSKIDSQDDSQFARSKIEILAELTRIRQICCDPSLCFEDYRGESAKREACIDLVKSLVDGGHKALVFSQFTSMLALLEEDFKKENIGYYKITGETSKEDRMEMVRSFNEDDTPIFLISLKAGGTGLNLTGADVVIHYDPWWNIAAQNQATDRAHRIGQTKVVTVYRIILKNTIEEKILQMQEQKKKLADDILSGESISSTALTREDLLQLLE